MIKKSAGASICGEDQNNLLPFYRDMLGLKVVNESQGFRLERLAVMELPGGRTHLEFRLIK